MLCWPFFNSHLTRIQRLFEPLTTKRRCPVSMQMISIFPTRRVMPLALLFVCLALPSLTHGLSALWPAARYAGGFIGEPLMVDSDYEKREAFPAFLGQKRGQADLAMLDGQPALLLAGPKERRAPFSAEEDRWMKAMDNMRKPRFG